MSRYTILLVFLMLLLFSQCSPEKTLKFNVVPTPQQHELSDGSFVIDGETTIIILNDSLKPLANLISEKINEISGLKLKISSKKNDKNSIILEYKNDLDNEAYRLNVGKNIYVNAANYNSMTMAMATLMQMVNFSENTLSLPYVKITDQPDYGFRGVMIDVARFWHPVETLKETIDLLWLYKIKYLGLHLSDNRRFTFPLEDYPKLKTINEDGSREYYTIDELNDLVEYAKQRGITIIPEVDLPGHSAQLWRKYPEIFGHVDSKTKQPKELYVVNIAKDETYEASAKIIKKLAEVFYTSPYINIGADEVYLEVIKSLPEYKTFSKNNNLKTALAGDPNELFCYFITQMHEVVKQTGKKSLIWEGFHDTGAGRIIIPKDITVIVWNTTYNHPKDLISNGYNIINSTWVPWYMVGAMNLAPSPEKGYNWNPNKWSHWKDDIEDVEVEVNQSTKGGQISFWEQNYYKVIPVLRERVPILSERLWNNKNPIEYQKFNEKYKEIDQLYSKFFRPIEIISNNLLHEQDFTFDANATISLKSNQDGVIKYTYLPDWGLSNLQMENTYKEPFTINKSGVLTVQKYNNDNQKIGYPVQQYYQKIVPSYTYKIFGEAPTKGWKEMPDFSKLELIREGVTGKMTPDRIKKINGELFAKVKKEGHIETRFYGLYNQYALELKGNLVLPNDNEYLFKIQTHDGLAELYIDNKLITKGEEFKNIPEEFKIDLIAGKHSFEIKYFYKEIQNQLSILYKTPKMDDFAPFENLVESIK